MTSNIGKGAPSHEQKIPSSIRLSPFNTLHYEGTPESAPLLSIQKDFANDWRKGWFRLAADKLTKINEPTICFWQEIAAHYLTMLCHLPSEMEFAPFDPPEADRLNAWVLCAPPMVGGEYLSLDSLCALWNEMNQWVASRSSEHGGIHHFLAEWAPQWQQVGRVCFHLAENKKNPDRPFAFLATYSTGFGAGGRLQHLPLKQALQQYSGTNNRQALIRLLTPVHNASQKCTWVQELLSTAELYQPLAWTAPAAYNFLCSVPQLEECGLSVRTPNWWKSRPRPQVSVTIGSTARSLLGVESLLDFNVHVALGDETLTEQELDEILSSTQNLINLRGQWVELDREKLQEAISHWKKVQQLNKNGQISFIEGMRLLAGAPAGLNESNLNEESYSRWVKILPGAALSEILSNLRKPSRISSLTLENPRVSLRPYQHEGVKWLRLLTELGLGACLADDMGLGKTVQILSLLLLHQQLAQDGARHPSLLIVPASLLANWQREAERFTPSLKLFLLHPSQLNNLSVSDIEKSPSTFFQEIDLVVTTYTMIVRLKGLSQISWDLVILDEAQAIKNPGTQQTKAIKLLKSRSRIALTGTPIENRLSDLWSLFDFLNPGLLGTSTRFKEFVAQPQGNSGQYEMLRKLTSPYILRRMKTDPTVISDLPQKIETTAYCYLSKEQAGIYRCIVDELGQTLKTIDSKNRRGAVLKALLQLKQICNHPSQYKGNEAYDPSQSGKFERLHEICEELASRQEKVLIFTQFSEIIAPIEQFVSRIFGRRGLILHGGTPIHQRKTLVEAFQSKEGPPFFVLSLKAGGTGLTLTEASHVIHFDRWWNPAVENQATDRAFRIGQRKNVQVHKFITQGTVEEQIDAIITSKKKLSEDILGSSDEVRITEMADDELLSILALDIDRAVQ